MAVSMVPTVGVVVVRDGKRVRPEIGKAYDFTKEERDAILEAHPTALRKPQNEETGEDSSKPAASTKRTAEASQSKASGGKKAATASKADSEDPETSPPAGEGGGPGAGTDDDL